MNSFNVVKLYIIYEKNKDKKGILTERRGGGYTAFKINV